MKPQLKSWSTLNYIISIAIWVKRTSKFVVLYWQQLVYFKDSTSLMINYSCMIWKDPKSILSFS